MRVTLSIPFDNVYQHSVLQEYNKLLPNTDETEVLAGNLNDALHILHQNYINTVNSYRQKVEQVYKDKTASESAIASAAAKPDSHSDVATADKEDNDLPELLFQNINAIPKRMLNQLH